MNGQIVSMFIHFHNNHPQKSHDILSKNAAFNFYEYFYAYFFMNFDRFSNIFQNIFPDFSKNNRPPNESKYDTFELFPKEPIQKPQTTIEIPLLVLST